MSIYSHKYYDSSDAAHEVQEKDNPVSREGRSQEYFSIAQALSSDFESIYYVDTDNDSYTEFTAQGAYEDLKIELTGTNFFEETQRNLLNVIYQEDQKRVSDAMRKETLLGALQDNRLFAMEYRLLIRGVPTWYRLKVVPAAQDHHHVVIGISNIDAMKRKELEFEATRTQNITFSSVAQALAADYFSIYYVNIENDHFIEFTSHDEYQVLNIEKSGDDFFTLSRHNVLRVMHPDDQEGFLEIFTKENILKELDKTGTFTIVYRLMFGDTPTYVNLKATRMQDKNDPHIVIGVNNVDAQMKREEDLAIAREKANRDALTGVKSKHAYVETEERVDALIRSGMQDPFAIAVCDVNGLKTINDTQGHQAGDQLIRDAAMIICRTFQHSPVFRIGGDEFTVILRGSDYENRDALMQQMAACNEESRLSGGVIIASGMASFADGKDTCAADVFERADAQMYRNKAKLKEMM